MKPLTITLLSTAIISFCACHSEKEITTMETPNNAPEESIQKVEKTEAEWKAQLTPEQYRVARLSGTEQPWSKDYEEFKKQGPGSYHCVGCDAKLFTSNEKFDARCGWPAFYDPAKAENVVTKEDRSAGMIRIEVNCAKCDAHLGHLFKGEAFDTPTKQRYCINGIVLKFVPDKAAESE